MKVSRLRFWVWFLSVFLSFFLQFFLSPPPVAAQLDPNCIGSLELKDSWKNHFPFDLIYPINSNPATADPGEECPTVVLWDIEYKLCTPSMLIGIVKNAFLIKLVVSSLINL